MEDEWKRKKIIAESIPIIESYAGVPITIRQLHYRLVSIGMPNTDQHYARVKGAMAAARWNYDVDFAAFIDRERAMEGETKSEITDLDDEIGIGKAQVAAWMRAYNLNRWENQDNYIEVWIEKKALQGVFEEPCRTWDVALGACKGYPSLTFLYEAEMRFHEALGRGQDITILYYGDYDPSGVDIPRSLLENLERMGGELLVEVIALHPYQIEERSLPPKPVKKTDTRARGWTGGTVELDAVEPRDLQRMCEIAIQDYFDIDKYAELKEREEEERKEYQKHLRKFVNEL